MPSRPTPARPAARRAPARTQTHSQTRPQTRSQTRSQTRPTVARAAASGAKSRAPRAEKPQLDPNDAGVQRRARKRAARRRNNWLAWVLVAALSVVIAGAATGVWQEYQGLQKKIGTKEGTLSDLSAQLQRKQRRVQALTTREGKERALVEGGYLGEGERFLLFPKKRGQAPQ